MLRAPIVLLLVMVGACGPIGYIGEVTRGASTAIEGARAAQADKYAPYYWTRANQYFRAAHEDAARADFQGANRFGRLAREAAELAATEALLAQKDPSKRPLDSATDDEPKPKPKLAPVKDTP